MSSGLPYSAAPEWLRGKNTAVHCQRARERTRITIVNRNHRILTCTKGDDCPDVDDDCCRLPTDRIPTSPNQSPENCAIKRLQLELKDFMMGECDTGMSAFPEKDTMMLWKGNITGGKGFFEGKQYTLYLHFPNDYPFKPPVVRFDRPAPFHPNVGGYCYRCYGRIKLDILLQEWSSAYDVRTVLLSIKTMLEDPNLSAPVNRDAARLWSDQKEYRKMVEKFYNSPRYGLEKRFIDLYEVKLCGSGEDSKPGSKGDLRQRSSYIKRLRQVPIVN
ncbi:hypothetical protein ACLB2K_075044 [Fragaria x ananassa]